MYTYDNSLSIHTLLYIHTYIHTYVCMYIRTYTHACSRDEGHTCADTLTKVKTVSLGTGEKAPI